jgi:hypothetical protein
MEISSTSNSAIATPDTIIMSTINKPITNTPTTIPQITKNQQTTTNLPDVKEALNEYFKLKLNYEIGIMINKKNIMNNTMLSNKEKRSEFLKLKPKCINCKRPGGTRFETTFFAETEDEEAYRQHSATCGIIADPCNLNIKIQVGKVELLPELLNSIQNDIKIEKDKLIDNKNKQLFGYLTTEEVLNNFDVLKDKISYFAALYDAYLDTYNNIVDNDKIKEELSETITDTYIQINQIKDCIKKMNETDNVQYARDAVNIYVNTLVPLMNKSRTLKYNENMVWYNNDTHTCNLIQNKYSIQNLSYSSFQSRVVEYNIGLQVESKKPPLIIESSSEEIETNDVYNDAGTSRDGSNENKEGKFVMKIETTPQTM